MNLRKEVLLEQEQEILNVSDSGVRPKEIKNYLSFNASYQRILRVLKKHNKPLEGSGGKNAVILNNPFENLTNVCFYWLGFLAADGAISSKKYSISLKIADIDHVLLYKDFINSELKYYDSISGAGTTLRNVMFGSKITHEFLINLGITPKKSLTLEIQIPLNWNFIRGYFDGNGCVSNYRPKITTGSEKFCKQLCSFYESQNVKYYVTIKGKCFDIHIASESRVFVYEQMYKDTTLYLKRKESKFRAALTKVKVKKMG